MMSINQPLNVRYLQRHWLSIHVMYFCCKQLFHDKIIVSFVIYFGTNGQNVSLYWKLVETPIHLNNWYYDATLTSFNIKFGTNLGISVVCRGETGVSRENPSVQPYEHMPSHLLAPGIESAPHRGDAKACLPYKGLCNTCKKVLLSEALASFSALLQCVKLNLM